MTVKFHFDIMLLLFPILRCLLVHFGCFTIGDVVASTASSEPLLQDEWLGALSVDSTKHGWLLFEDDSFVSKIICFEKKIQLGSNAKMGAKFDFEKSNYAKQQIHHCKRMARKISDQHMKYKPTEVLKHRQMPTEWHAIELIHGPGQLLVRTSFTGNTTCKIKYSWRKIYLQLSTGLLYPDFDTLTRPFKCEEKSESLQAVNQQNTIMGDTEQTPCNTENANQNMCPDTKDKFIREQGNGAFLDDYAGMWMLASQMRGCSNDGGTIVLYDSLLFAEAIPPPVLEDADCKVYEKDVKIAFINDSHPGHVVRIGYVYGELMNVPVSDDVVKAKFKETFMYIQFADDPEIRKWFSDKHKFARLNPGEFRYAEVPSELVNQNGIVRMVFQTCYHNATVGMYVKKADSKASSVDAVNDWSKDFEVVSKCEESALIRIEQSNKNHYNVCMLQCPVVAGAVNFRVVKADNALPVRIGIRTALNLKLPDQIKMQYMFGFSDLPRPHLQESADRIAKWGRFLMDKEEGYKPAQIFVDMSVRFVEVNRDIIRKLGYIILSHQQQASLPPLVVQPELLQMFYTCPGFNIYTPRFKVTQTAMGIADADGNPYLLQFDATVMTISLDGRKFEVPVSPKDANLQEIFKK